MAENLNDRLAALDRIEAKARAEADRVGLARRLLVTAAWMEGSGVEVVVGSDRLTLPGNGNHYKATSLTGPIHVAARKAVADVLRAEAERLLEAQDG